MSAANLRKLVKECFHFVSTCRLAKEGSSDTGTETIDWLELKRAVDTEQGLPCKLLPFSVSCVAANHFYLCSLLDLV